MTVRSPAVCRAVGCPKPRPGGAANEGAASSGDSWRGTVRLLLDCPDVDARDQDALRRVTGWRRLGRIEEVWPATLAASHLGEVGEDWQPGSDDNEPCVGRPHLSADFPVDFGSSE